MRRRGIHGLGQVGETQTSTRDKSSEGGWVSWRQFPRRKRGMRNEAETWVEGKARSQRWGVPGLHQVGVLQASTGDKSSEEGDG